MQNVIDLKRRSPSDILKIAYDRLSNNEQISNDISAMGDLLLIKGAISELENPWRRIADLKKDSDDVLISDADGWMKVSRRDSNGYINDPDDHYYSELLEWIPAFWTPLPKPPREDE